MCKMSPSMVCEAVLVFRRRKEMIKIMAILFNIIIILSFILLMPMINCSSIDTDEVDHGVNDEEFYNHNDDSENILLNSDLEPESFIKENYDKSSKTNKNIQSDDYADQNNLRSLNAQKNTVEFVDTVSIKNELPSDEPHKFNNKQYYVNNDAQYNQRNQQERFDQFNKNNVETNILFKSIDEPLQSDFINTKIHGKNELNHLQYGNININRSNEDTSKKRLEFLNVANNDDVNSDYEEDNYDYSIKNSNDNTENKCKKNHEIECKREKQKPLKASLIKYNGKLCQPKPIKMCAMEEKENKNKSKKHNDNECRDLGVLQPIQNDSNDIVLVNEKSYSKISNTDDKPLDKNTLLKSAQNQINNKYNTKRVNLEPFSSNEDYDLTEMDFHENKIKAKPYIKSKHEHDLYHYKIRGNENKGQIDDLFHPISVLKLKQKGYYYRPKQIRGENSDGSKEIVLEEPRQLHHKVKYRKKHIFSPKFKQYPNLVQHDRAGLSDTVQINPNENVRPEPRSSLPSKPALYSEINQDKHTRNTNENVKINHHTLKEFFGQVEKLFPSNDNNPHFPDFDLNKVGKRLPRKEKLSQESVKNNNGYLNDEIPINDANNATILCSDYMTDPYGNLEIDTHDVSKFKQNEKLFSSNNLNRNEYFAIPKHTNNNKTQCKSVINENDPDIYTVVDSNVELTDGTGDHKKRSITEEEHAQLTNQFNDRSKKSTNQDEIQKMIGSNSNKNKPKKSNSYYNYESSKTNENDIGNFEDINERTNDFKEKDSNHNMKSYSGKKLSLIENFHRKKGKQLSNKDSDLVTDFTDNKQKLISSSGENRKSKKKPVEQIHTISDSKKDPFFRVTAGVSNVSSKKFTYNYIKSKFRHQGTTKPSDQKCLPTTRPPKFKWCSDEANLVKDQEYEDALRGRVALRIVEVILAKVHKSPKIAYDFGFSSNLKKENECGHDSGTENSILKSQDLKDIMRSMNGLSCKTCNQLPPKLKDFLEWLIKVKSVRSVNVQETFGMHSNCSLGDSAFLFHHYGLALSNDNQNSNDNVQASQYSSPYETDICDESQINKAENILGVNGEVAEDIDLTSDNEDTNELLKDQQRQSYNGKLKRYATAEEIIYPENNDNVVTGDEFKFPFYARNSFNAKDMDPNLYKGQDNPYDYYANTVKDTESNKQQREIHKYSPLKDVNNVNAFHSKPDNREQISFYHPQYKKENAYGSDAIKHNYDDLSQIRKKRNNKKSQLQDLLIDTQPDLNFGVQMNHQNINDELAKIISDNGEGIRTEILDENDQQLGFYTPVVFRVPDDYDII